MNHLYSEMSEQALLGLIMQENSNWRLIEGKITADDFYFPIHRLFFGAMADLKANGVDIWPGSVIPAIVSADYNSEQLAEYCGKLFESVGLGASILAASFVIADCSYKRKMIGMAKSLTEAVERKDDKTSASIQQDIATLSKANLNVLPDDPLEQIQSAFHAAVNPEPMMLTGIESWDNTFGGIAKGVRYIIAGMGGAGKTALALNIGWNIAKRGGKVRHIFFEGKNEEIWHRIMSREMAVPITAFRKGLSPAQQSIVTNKQDILMGKDFAVVRDPRNVGEMIARCGPCDLIIMDGISSAPAQGADSLIERVAMITAYCKTLADTTGAAVLMLAHLNSEGIKNAGTGTGIFGGQSATFDPESIIELKADEDTKGQKLRKITGIVTKNRYGELGKINFSFNGEYMTYGDWRDNV